MAIEMELNGEIKDLLEESDNLIIKSVSAIQQHLIDKYGEEAALIFLPVFLYRAMADIYICFSNETYIEGLIKVTKEKAKKYAKNHLDGK